RAACVERTRGIVAGQIVVTVIAELVVLTQIAVEPVVAGAAVHLVAALGLLGDDRRIGRIGRGGADVRVGVQEVVAVAAPERLPGLLAVDGGRVAADAGIVLASGVSEQVIVAAVAVYLIDAVVAVQRVLSVAATDHVVAVAAVDEVIARAAVDVVR